MSSIYNGIPVYPTGLTITSDGDPRNASSVNVPIQGLADRTEYLRTRTDNVYTAVNKARYLNWPSGVNTGLVGYSYTTKPVPCAYDAKNGRLVLAGTVPGSGTPDPSLVLVQDAGAMGAPSVNLLTAFTGDSSYAPLSVAVDDAGNAVVSTFGRYVFDIPVANIGAAARRDAFGAVVTSGASSVIYNPATGYWVLVASSTASAVPVCRQSTNRTTWTPVANALATGAVYSYLDLAVNPGGTILCAALTGSTVRIARTTNNGSSWSTELAITTAVASPGHVQVSYDQTRSLWLLVVGSSVASELWTSPDAISWTKKRTTSDVSLGKIAVDEFGTYVTCCTGNVLQDKPIGPAFSTDGGLTFSRVGIQPPPQNGNQPARSFYTGSGFVCVTGQSNAIYAMFSLRTGDPVLTAVT